MDTDSVTAYRPPDRIGLVIGLALAGLILWTAWDFGGGYVATKWVMSIALSLLLLGRLLWQVRHRRSSIAPPAVAVVACLIACGGLVQTIELPLGWVRSLSPATAAAYVDWVPDQPRAQASDAGKDVPSDQFMPISVAPELTRMAIALPVAFGVAAWLSSICFGRGRAGMLFLAIIAIGGATFAFFGLADEVLLSQANTQWDRLVITPTGTRSAFGPFVNNNNGGGFLLLAIGCALGAVTGLMRSKPSGPQTTSDTIHAKQSSHDQQPALKKAMRSCLLAACLLAILVLIAGVFGSNSRGAFLGLVAGSFCFSIVVLRSGVKSRLVLVISGLSCVSCILLLGIGLLSRFRWRIETLWSGEAMNDPRLAHWNDSWNAAVQYFPCGAGLGTYRYAHLPFQKQGGDLWFLHADGMPFEWFLEGGLWLIGLIAIACGMILRDLFRIANRLHTLPPGQRQTAEAFLLATLFALPSMIVSQCFDYGILQPPLLLTLACLCGGLASAARGNQSAQHVGRMELQRSPSSLPLQQIVSWGTGILLCVGIVFSVVELHVGSMVERLERGRIAAGRKSLDEVPSFQPAIGQLHFLASMRPKAASVHLLLARLMIDEQRRLGVEFLMENNLASRQAANAIVSPPTLRKACYASTKRPIDQLMLPGQDLESWNAARSHAAAALALCPLDDTARILLVELDMLDASFAATSPELIEQLKTLRRGNRQMSHCLEAL